MLDCHIIVRNDTPPDWLRQCVGSVMDAARYAGYPVHVHLVPSIEGHIGKARSVGYAQGSQPYVTYVDDDDYVSGYAFAALTWALSQAPDAIFPAESQLQNGHLNDGPQRHHLCVYRREHLIDHAQWIVCGDLAQMNAVDGKHCIDVTDRLYVHRLYQSGGRKLRREHHDELRAARG